MCRLLYFIIVSKNVQWGQGKSHTFGPCAMGTEKIAHFFCSKSVLYDKISNKLICFFVTYSLLFLELKNILNNYLNKGG